VASSALAAGSRLSQGPTASSTSAACATACTPGYASRAEVLRRAGLTHPHTPPARAPVARQLRRRNTCTAVTALRRSERRRDRAWATALSGSHTSALPTASGPRLSAASTADRASGSRPSSRSASSRETSILAWTGKRLWLNAASAGHDEVMEVRNQSASDSSTIHLQIAHVWHGALYANVLPPHTPFSHVTSAPTHMQCYRTQQGSHQHPPGHAAAGNVVADVLQVRHLSFVFAHAQWRVDTRAALVGVLYQGAAIRCAAANLV